MASQRGDFALSGRKLDFAFGGWNARACSDRTVAPRFYSGKDCPTSPLPVLITPESSLPNETFKLKTILCPTNFSEGSVAALRHAWHFAKAFSAHIILLHVVEGQGLDRADRISQRMKAEGPMSRLSSALSAGDRSTE